MSGESRNSTKIGGSERRASQRLAADLLRFERAFDRLERQRMGLGSIPPDAPAEALPAAGERDMQDYLHCLDEALRQLAEEFAGDASVAAALEKHGVSSAAHGTQPLRGPNGPAFDPVATGPTLSSQIDTSAV